MNDTIFVACGSWQPQQRAADVSRVKIETAPSHPVSIFIAGDYATALQACREHCMAVGLCVTVTATEYVYTGGCESGVIVGLINYPRFPTTPDDIEAKATALAHVLIERLCQHSATIQMPTETVWLSRRPEARSTGAN